MLKFPAPKWIFKAGPRPKQALGLLLLAFLLLERPAFAQQAPLRINTASVEPFVTEDQQGFLDLMIAEVFKRVGKNARINRYHGASARSMKMANNGSDDGEALRIKGQEKNFPNLIRVPEPILINQFVANSIPNSSEIQTWRDLEGHDVGYIIGWWIFKKNLGNVKTVTTVRTSGQLFSLLKRGRIDVALYEKWQGLWVARSLGVKVKVHEPALAKIPMFLYLHQKHAALVPRVAQALAGMKKDGSYQNIYDRVLTPLIPH